MPGMFRYPETSDDDADRDEPVPAREIDWDSEYHDVMSMTPDELREQSFTGGPRGQLARLAIICGVDKEKEAK